MKTITTVGDLRKAMEGVDDSMPVILVVDMTYEPSKDQNFAKAPLDWAKVDNPTKEEDDRATGQACFYLSGIDDNGEEEEPPSSGEAFAGVTGAVEKLESES